MRWYRSRVVVDGGQGLRRAGDPRQASQQAARQHLQPPPQQALHAVHQAEARQRARRQHLQADKQGQISSYLVVHACMKGFNHLHVRDKGCGRRHCI